jgi:hypothetical protein
MDEAPFTAGITPRSVRVGNARPGRVPHTSAPATLTRPIRPARELAGSQPTESSANDATMVNAEP